MRWKNRVPPSKNQQSFVAILSLAFRLSLICLLPHYAPHTFKMPISKKDRIHREHKKAEAAGTRIPVNPNGTPVKPKKATSICVFCKKEIVSLDHAQKAPKSPLPSCVSIVVTLESLSKHQLGDILLTRDDSDQLQPRCP
jgi:hypothetical protein